MVLIKEMLGRVFLRDPQESILEQVRAVVSLPFPSIWDTDAMAGAPGVSRKLRTGIRDLRCNRQLPLPTFGKSPTPRFSCKCGQTEPPSAPISWGYLSGPCFFYPNE